MHHAQALSLDPVEPRRRQRQPARVRQTDALDHKRRDLRRQQAQAGLGQAELRLVISQRNITDARQTKATAQHRALQHHDHHLGHGFNFLQQGAERAVQRLQLRLVAGAEQVFHVRPGTEMPGRAADHQRAHLIVQLRQHRAQFIDHLQAHRVAALRTVEGDVQHTVMGFEQQGVHGFFPGRVPISLQMMPSMISSAPPPIDTRRISR